MKTSNLTNQKNCTKPKGNSEKPKNEKEILKSKSRNSKNPETRIKNMEGKNSKISKGSIKRKNFIKERTELSKERRKIRIIKAEEDKKLADKKKIKSKYPGSTEHKKMRAKKTKFFYKN